MSVWAVPSLFAVMTLTCFLSYVLIRRPPVPMWPSVPLALVAALVFAVGDVLTYVAVDSQYTWEAVAFLYSGIVFVPPTWWLLAHRFAETIGQPFSWGRSRWVYVPFVFAALLWLGMITNPWHGQFLTPVPNDRNTYHWMWWLYTSIQYTLVVITIGLYVALVFRVASRLRRKRIIVMITAPLLNVAGNLLYVLAPTPIPFDPTALGFCLSGALFLVGIYRIGVFSLSPVAMTKILRHQPNGIVVTDIEGNLLYWNPAAETHLQHALDDIHSNFYSWLGNRLALTDETNEVIGGATLREQLDRPEGLPLRLYRLINKDERWLSIRLAEITSRNDDPVGWSYLIEDHTQHRKDELDRAALQGQMAQAQKLESLGTLAGGIAHDFNNLLMAIRGNTELALTDKTLENGVRRRLDVIEDASVRAARLTGQLLAYAGAARTQTHVLSVSELVEQNLELLRTAVSPRGLSLTLELGDDTWIQGDPAQIEQVLMNLTINAAEAYEGHTSNAGRVSIHTGVAEMNAESLAKCMQGSEIPPGRFVFLEVRDLGSGMNANAIDQVFDPFYTTKGTGRGLGLAAVLGIVRNHHGAVRLDTSLGRGTSVCVFFPLDAELTTSPPADQITSPLSLPNPVLVVDDEDTVRDVICGLLGRAGMSTLSAENGKTAIAILTEHRDQIDLAILDVAMPGMDGFATLRALREIKPELPIIFMSGHPQEDLEAQLRWEPHLHYQMKPFSEMQIIQKIREALS